MKLTVVVEIKVNAEDQRRPVLSREERINLSTLEPTTGGKRRERGRRTTTQGQGVQRHPRRRRDTGKRRKDQSRRGKGGVPVQGGRWKTIHQMEKDEN